MMSEPGVPLGGEAADLLFDLADNPQGRFASWVLDEHFPDSASVLKSTGLLAANGHTTTIVDSTDHDDRPINLDWWDEHQAHGYFSPTEGLVLVPSERLVQFQVDLDAMLDRVLNGLDLSPRFHRVTLVPDLLWEVGGIRLPGRAKRVPVWVGRGFGNPAVWESFMEQARRRPAPGLRLVLVLTPEHRIPKSYVQGHEVVSVRSVVDHLDGLSIDPDILAARLTYRADSDAPVTLAADGGSITVRGKTYTFKGIKQRDVVRQLFEAWQSGQPERLTSEVLEIAEYSDTVNTLAKAFSGRTDWCEFIREEGGRCWISL